MYKRGHIEDFEPQPENALSTPPKEDLKMQAFDKWAGVPVAPRVDAQGRPVVQKTLRSALPCMVLGPTMRCKRHMYMYVDVSVFEYEKV